MSTKELTGLITKQSEDLQKLHEEKEKLLTMHHEIKEELSKQNHELRIELKEKDFEIKNLQEKILKLETDFKKVIVEKNELIQIIDKKRKASNESSKKAHAKKRAKQLENQ